jgi:diaminopimelate decarboxylase
MTLLDILPSLRSATRPRIDSRIWPLTTRVDELGRLTMGAVPLTEVADQFGTPAYVLDESEFCHRARQYRTALAGVEVLYGARSLLTTTVARWVRDAALGAAVCSTAELATALAGGIDPARIVLHGRAKCTEELALAVQAGVGRIVLDSPLEIAYLAGLAPRPQLVLLRTSPEVDVTSMLARALAAPQLKVAGLYCRLGSQIADPEVYVEAVRQLVATMSDIRTGHGVVLTELNIGGGQAVELHPAELANFLEDVLDAACAAERFPRPRLVVEPGRAISARAGVTLLRVQSVSTHANGRTSVATDGVLDSETKHPVVLANRHPVGPTAVATVLGRDNTVIAEDIALPATVHPGDLLAVGATGAYHHAMSARYALSPRPPVIAVRDRQATALVRRETVADLLLRDCG